MAIKIKNTARLSVTCKTRMKQNNLMTKERQRKAFFKVNVPMLAI